jgi:hypothetical protein
VFILESGYVEKAFVLERAKGVVNVVGSARLPKKQVQSCCILPKDELNSDIEPEEFAITLIEKQRLGRYIT